MWNRVTGGCLFLVLSGCLRDPDPGGQEGEEIRQGDMVEESTTLEVDTGASPEDAPGQDDSTDSDRDTGLDGGEGGGTGTTTEPVDPDEWIGWVGAFRIERGSSTEPTARDCVLVFDMQGTRTDDCADCVAGFTVRHELTPDASSGQDVCADVPATFARDYEVRETDDGRFELYIGGPDTSPVFYGPAEIAENTLSWTVGSVAIPSTTDGGETVYRTDVETGVATLD
ncbi:MAG: hypothetical protein CL927_11370 [Deltaproteobacteria bacterium]|nr:hypothetical protein [Deltaproteobacteria bacterium]HCH61560.1 hypothetical protein [Deltaproteobacteria bacterium]